MRMSTKFTLLVMIFIVIGVGSGFIFDALRQNRRNNQKTELLLEFQRRQKYQFDMLTKAKVRIEAVVDKSSRSVERSQEDSDSIQVFLRKSILLLMETEHMIDELEELRQGDSTLFIMYGK